MSDRIPTKHEVMGAKRVAACEVNDFAKNAGGDAHDDECRK